MEANVSIQNGKIFKSSTLAGSLALDTYPGRLIDTPEKREAQRASQAYMDANPYAPETQLALSVQEAVRNLDGAYDDHSYNFAKSLQSKMPELSENQVSAAFGIALESYASNAATSGPEGVLDETRYDNLLKKGGGVLAQLNGTSKEESLNKIHSDKMSYQASYGSHYQQIEHPESFVEPKKENELSKSLDNLKASFTKVSQDENSSCLTRHAARKMEDALSDASESAKTLQNDPESHHSVFQKISDTMENVCQKGMSILEKSGIPMQAIRDKIESVQNAAHDMGAHLGGSIERVSEANHEQVSRTENSMHM